jgi:uncharacterized membrane protein
MTGIFIGAFAGSLIELVEIFAVALIVGRIAGWHNALLGAGSAMLLTALVSLFVGTGLTRIPVTALAARHRPLLRGATAKAPR